MAVWSGEDGRKAGAVDGYADSKGLAEADFVWNESTLDPWLENPRAVIPGDKMALNLSKPQDRADVIAYMKSLSEQ